VWLRELRHFSSPDIKIFLIGNKSDLEEKREVSLEKGLKFKEENNIDFFLETSAKSGFNIDEIFQKAAVLLYKEYLKYNPINNSVVSGSQYDSVETKNSSYNFKLRDKKKKLKQSEETNINKSLCPC
jgi:GTPase SAR1 family protein